VMEVLSPAQLDRFLTEADKSVFGPCLRFIAATGVRRGEAVALRWDAVDLEQGTATISRNLTKIGGTFVHGKPKTKKGERKVPLDSETVTMLKDLRRAHAEETLRSGSRWNESGYVFTRADGSHLLPDSITQAAKRLTKALGLPNLAVHSLRHSYATAGLAVGMPTKIMSDILGHSTTRLTEDTYQHSTAEMMAGAAEMIAALRRGSNAASGAVQT
jgi:integrase